MQFILYTLNGPFCQKCWKVVSPPWPSILNRLRKVRCYKKAHTTDSGRNPKSFCHNSTLLTNTFIPQQIKRNIKDISLNKAKPLLNITQWVTYFYISFRLFYVYGYFACMCTMFVSGVLVDNKGASDSLGLELLMDMSHVGAENQTLVLSKSNKCSKPEPSIQHESHSQSKQDARAALLLDSA